MKKHVQYLLLEKTRILNFVLPNLSLLCRSKEIYFGKKLRFNQKTFITGHGITKIGYGSSFGYQYGSFHYKGSIEFHTRFANAVISIGENISSNNNIYICAGNRVEIGNDTIIGQNVYISDMEGHGIHPSKRKECGIIGTVKIGMNVWIGNNVIILKNSSIGNNSIVAAGAIVSGIFPDDVIIGGIPAKIIRSVYDE